MLNFPVIGFISVMSNQKEYMRDYMRRKRQTDKAYKELCKRAKIITAAETDAIPPIQPNIIEIVQNEENINDIPIVEEIVEEIENNIEVEVDLEGDHIAVQEEENADVLWHVAIQEQNVQEQFVNGLARWSVVNNIRSLAINELLLHIRQYLPFVPKDCRTIKHTQRSVEVVEVCGGEYVYMGLRKAIIRHVEKIDNTQEKLSVLVNVDGIPMFDSSGIQLWPILGSINDYKPFSIALWIGKTKPKNVSDYLNDFIIEVQELTNVNFVHAGREYIITLQGFVCDTPARSFLKCVTGHTGYNCCERCTERGQYIAKSIRLVGVQADLRTSDDFARGLYGDGEHPHQNGDSPLLQLDCDMINMFLLDYMHLCCLGVVRKYLRTCKKTEGRGPITNINASLIKMKPHVPSAFQRRPRSLEELDHWKATELRFFMLYGGIVALRGNVSKRKYNHFCRLTIAMRILTSKHHSEKPANLQYAKGLLKYYVQDCIILYGPESVTYNTHTLIHLADDVIYHKKPLDEISAFPFENYLGHLKGLVHSAVTPIRQIVKRLAEKDRLETIPPTPHIAISTRVRDSVYMADCGRISIVKEILNNDTVVCEVVRDNKVKDLFIEPKESSNFNILHVTSLANPIVTRMNKNDLGMQCVMLPLSGDEERGYAVMPLVHNEYSHYN